MLPLRLRYYFFKTRLYLPRQQDQHNKEQNSLRPLQKYLQKSILSWIWGIATIEITSFMILLLSKNYRILKDIQNELIHILHLMIFSMLESIKFQERHSRNQLLALHTSICPILCFLLGFVWMLLSNVVIFLDLCGFKEFPLLLSCSLAYKSQDTLLVFLKLWSIWKSHQSN